MKAPKSWQDLTIAIVGGDEREQEIARLAADTGASVSAFGFPFPDEGIGGVNLASSASDALQDAHIVLFPIPGMTMDGAIFATEKIVPDRALLAHLRPGARIILGTADDGLKSAARELGIALHEYESDHELMLLRAPAIVEAAIRVLIENTRITLHGNAICVVGFGNIGSVLVRTLVAMGAHVTVAARNPVQRAMAYTMGAESMHTNDLEARARDFPIIISSVPAPLINHQVIDSLTQDTLLVDLSAPPGSIDFSYAERRGLRAIWARALGRRAPVTVGASQWFGIRKLITSALWGNDNES
ncbi:MAG: dipicolinate synthase subunit DpsA [Haliea sp.]|uniref:dipicolinate synthase subunit DpsA n=1 Tax=Haliea sp. TaxID=1932666 RepID=UPI0032EF8AE4